MRDSKFNEGQLSSVVSLAGCKPVAERLGGSIPSCPTRKGEIYENSN